MERGGTCEHMQNASVQIILRESLQIVDKTRDTFKLRHKMVNVCRKWCQSAKTTLMLLNAIRTWRLFVYRFHGPDNPTWSVERGQFT